MIRQGLSYDLIFEHGRAHLPTAAEQAAKFIPTSRDIGSRLPSNLKGSTSSNDSARRQQIEIKRAREAREQRNTYLSTSQALVPAHAAGRR